MATAVLEPPAIRSPSLQLYQHPLQKQISAVTPTATEVSTCPSAVELLRTPMPGPAPALIQPPPRIFQDSRMAPIMLPSPMPTDAPQPTQRPYQGQPLSAGQPLQRIHPATVDRTEASTSLPAGEREHFLTCGQTDLHQRTQRGYLHKLTLLQLLMQTDVPRQLLPP